MKKNKFLVLLAVFFVFSCFIFGTPPAFADIPSGTDIDIDITDPAEPQPPPGQLCTTVMFPAGVTASGLWFPEGWICYTLAETDIKVEPAHIDYVAGQASPTINWTATLRIVQKSPDIGGIGQFAVRLRYAPLINYPAVCDPEWNADWPVCLSNDLALWGPVSYGNEATSVTVSGTATLKVQKLESANFVMDLIFFVDQTWDGYWHSLPTLTVQTGFSFDITEVEFPTPTLTSDKYTVVAGEETFKLSVTNGAPNKDAELWYIMGADTVNAGVLCHTNASGNCFKNYNASDSSGEAGRTYQYYVIVAGKQSNTITVNFVGEPKCWSAPPTLISFSAIQGQGNPGPEVWQLANNGPASSNLKWVATDDKSWISLSPFTGTLSGGNSTYVFVNIDTADLTPGLQSGTLRMLDDGSSPPADNCPRFVTVSLDFKSYSYIITSPLSFNAEQNGNLPLPKNITVTNTGSQNLSITPISESISWATIDKSFLNLNPGASGTVTVSITTTNLSPQTYSGQINFTNSQGAGNKQTQINFLVNSPSTATLNVSKSGTGSGTVTAPVGTGDGINCGTTNCAENYISGTSVTLTASASDGSTFANWSGDADCSDGVVTMNASKSCTAKFNLQSYTLTVSKPGSGLGTVMSAPAGIECGLDCSENYNYGTPVILTASTDSGSTFAGWSGCDSTSGTLPNQTCNVDMTSVKIISATFNLSSTYVIDPNPASKQVGQTQQFIGWYDPDGPGGPQANQNKTTSASWNSSNTSIATINSSGLATCVAVGGPITITSIYSGINATASLTCSAVPTYSLTVSKFGTGSGTITSNPAGINCGSDCTENYNSGTSVTLTATAAAGSIFAGWSGDCSGTGSCVLTMSAAKNVTATFNISAPGCPSQPDSYPTNSWDRVWCDKSFVSKLADTPDEGIEQFTTDWGGGIVGGIRADDIGFRSGRTINFPYTGTYTFSLGSDDGIRMWIDGALLLDRWYDRAFVVDTFTSSLTAGNHQVRIDYYENGGGAAVSFSYTAPVVQYTLSVSKSGTGTGTITSNPAGINCGSDCTETYTSGTSVILTASAAADSTFVGWSGDCSGTGTCTVAMTAARNVTATFNVTAPQPNFGLAVEPNAIYVTILPGGSAKKSTDTTITAFSINGFSSTITLSASSDISGETYNFTPSNKTLTYNAGTGSYNSSTFSVTLPSTTPAGLYTITIKGADGGLIGTININLSVGIFNPNWREF